VLNRILALATLALAAAGPACSRGSDAAKGDEILVVVSAPVSQSPWIAGFTARGAQLAADELNGQGGIDAGGAKRRVTVDVRDNGGSPATAADVAREAVNRGAAALITDGVGAPGVAQVTGPAKLPTFVVFEGGAGVVGDDKPTLFRMAPANKPMATRLADFTSGLAPKVAVLHDDTSYGREGKAALDTAFARNEVPVVATAEVPATGTGIDPAVVKARQAGATLLVVWARAPVVAATVRAARAAGWDVPVHTGPTGEDPLVRQQLADHPEWVDGLTFVSFRITAEIGPEPFERFRSAYEKKFGRDEVGVKSKAGETVVMPPDWAMYSYDSVHLLAAALKRADGRLGAPLLEQLNQVSISGANGDERGFTEGNHEGVSPDDMYFGRFADMRFAPVADDILSQGLPPVPQ
jgi:ABC-type branched-subunit amino acid transport system substrate-binding protein